MSLSMGPLLYAGLVAAFLTSAEAQVAKGLDEQEQTIEIDASEGIEWLRDEKVYIARGDVRAVIGDLEVLAKVMKAHYHSDGENGEIYLIEIEGSVQLVTPGEKVYADYGRYDLVEERVELTGEGLRLESRKNSDRLSARDVLEYHRRERLAVARGDARVRRDEKEIRADVLYAYFEPNAEGDLEVARVEASGNVEIRSKGDYAAGDRAVYYAGEDRATLEGDVKVTRGENQLNGAFAEVNMATGVSRLTGGAPGSEKQERVKGIILPRSIRENDEDGEPPQ
jgi:lipopolysaccharide export system protein LptA